LFTKAVLISTDDYTCREKFQGLVNNGLIFLACILKDKDIVPQSKYQTLKLDLVRHPHFFGENKIECKYTVSKFS
jgi:hypothetical protein